MGRSECGAASGSQQVKRSEWAKRFGRREWAAGSGPQRVGHSEWSAADGAKQGIHSEAKVPRSTIVFGQLGAVLFHSSVSVEMNGGKLKNKIVILLKSHPVMNYFYSV